jgi:hypothetical protein
VKKPIPLGECALLSRADARRYVGCLSDELFDSEVARHVAPRMIRKRRFYRRSELDAWVEGPPVDGRNAFEKAIEDAYRRPADTKRPANHMPTGKR